MIPYNSERPIERVFAFYKIRQFANGLPDHYASCKKGEWLVAIYE